MEKQPDSLHWQVKQNPKDGGWGGRGRVLREERTENTRYVVSRKQGKQVLRGGAVIKVASMRPRTQDGDSKLSTDIRSVHAIGGFVWWF